MAFVKIGSPEDREHLLDLLSDEAGSDGEKQVGLFQILSRLDEMFYYLIRK